MTLVDAVGTLIRFLLLPGQTDHSKGTTPLINNVPFGAPLADKAFDSDGLLTEIGCPWSNSRHIPLKDSRKDQRACDKEACKWSRPIANFARIGVSGHCHPS